jgi:hypothetical protein
MQQKQEENESEAYKNLQPDAGEDPRHRLSARAQAVLHAVAAWAHQLPAGTVDVTYTLFPPEDDYGSELLITLQPHTPSGGVLTIGVISDTTYPFHFHLGEMNEITAAADLTLSRVVPAHLPLFLNHRGEVSPVDVVALCCAVATAQIRLTIGILKEKVWAAEAWVALPPGRQFQGLHGSNGPVRLVKLLCRWGYGTRRTMTFAAWR